MDSLDLQGLRGKYIKHGSFLYVENFLPAEITARLIAAVSAVEGSINRNYLPGHKQGGSVSRYAIDRQAPVIAELYRSAALLQWLKQLTGERLQLSPPDDPHAYALYFYTRRGDHIGWHYDTSYYAGRRYTLLLGLIDDSSCRLDYQLHTREKEAPVVSGSIKIAPGGLVVFNGDALRHRISPSLQGETRVSLTWGRPFAARLSPSPAPWGFRRADICCSRRWQGCRSMRRWPCRWQNARANCCWDCPDCCTGVLPRASM
ncbi:MAG: 2OG-Fe(II) oxygenase [Pseudomonadota bacterium]|nr:2OG-Fe(II) oxygenase [Pseudomonadota bacterium]